MDLDFFTPLPVAVHEIMRRRQDATLVSAVQAYLKSDIPAHFCGDKPVMYLCRHIATPNFETLRFLDIARQYHLPMVIGEDKNGIFVGNNELKRSLGKISVVKGIARNQDEIIENFTIVNFSEVQGSSFKDINTIFGTPLINFHHEMLAQIYPAGVVVADESDWIDRNQRDNLLEQYKRLFALQLVHGILFECYPHNEHQLYLNIVKPAFDFICNHFKYRPLVYELLNQEQDEDRNWNAYPSVLYRFISGQFGYSNSVKQKHVKDVLL